MMAMKIVQAIDATFVIAEHNARMRNIWITRLSTLGLWLLAAASATYWLIQTTARAAPSPLLAQATVAGQDKAPNLQPDTLTVAHGLGAVGDGVVAAPAADGAAAVDWNPSRFALSGIVAQGSEKDGLVMIRVDGKPAQILQVGATVEPNVVVQALSRQSVTLANIGNPDAPVLLTLTLGAKQSASGSAQLDTTAPSSAVQNPVTASMPVPPPMPAPPPAAAPAPEAPTPAVENAADAERDARRARLAERLEQRRAANANNPANTNGAAGNNNAAPAPAPRRSVLSDDNLYFKD